MSRSVECRNWRDGGCALGLFGGVPSPGTCARCDRWDGPPRGAGDLLHAIAERIGVHRVMRPCDGCARRRVALNTAVGFADIRRENRDGTYL